MTKRAELLEFDAGFVPGFGPISSRHLRASLALLERAIRRQLG